jgi:MOSC domain-containing protein YiiM
MNGRVHQISVSNGGVPKLAVASARVTTEGLEGDWQQNRKHHGGPDRAVCLFSLEVIRRLQAEGHPIVPGSVGENLTIEGLDWAAAVPGARLRIDHGNPDEAVVLDIVSYTEPCSTVRNSFAALGFRRILQDLHPGESRVYARVLREGRIHAGSAIDFISNVQP